MQRSATVARVVTVLIAVVITPIALVLLWFGGRGWIAAMEDARASGTGIDLMEVLGPLALQLLAVILLVGVVATGVWSSSGLFALSVLGVIALVLSVVPAALSALSGVGATVVPLSWLAATLSGLSLVLYPAMGAMGWVLYDARHRPASRGATLTAVGVVVVPLLVFLGGGVIAWGAGYAQLRAAQLFEITFQPAVAIAMVVGVALLVASVALSRWSPWALMIPAVALLAISIVLAFPRLHATVVGALPLEVVGPTSEFFLLGGGVAAAAIAFAFTFVLRTRRQPTA